MWCRREGKKVGQGPHRGGHIYQFPFAEVDLRKLTIDKNVHWGRNSTEMWRINNTATFS